MLLALLFIIELVEEFFFLFFLLSLTECFDSATIVFVSFDVSNFETKKGFQI